MTDAAEKTQSLRGYAKRRGVSPEAVSKAVKTGRLVNSVAWIDGVPKIGDPDLADREWEENTRSSEGNEPDPNTPDDLASYSEARRRREIEALKQARVKREADELELRIRKGEMRSVKELQASLEDVLTAVKVKLLSVPSRLRQRSADIAPQDVALVEELVRESLEELAAMGEAS